MSPAFLQSETGFIYTLPSIRSDRQKPHSPDRHFEGGFKFALSKAIKTDSVAIAGMSFNKLPIWTLILNIFSATSLGKSGWVKMSFTSPKASLRIRLTGNLNLFNSSSTKLYMICGPHMKKVLEFASQYFSIISLVIKPFSHPSNETTSQLNI